MHGSMWAPTGGDTIEISFEMKIYLGHSVQSLLAAFAQHECFTIKKSAKTLLGPTVTSGMLHHRQHGQMPTRARKFFVCMFIF